MGSFSVIVLDLDGTVFLPLEPYGWGRMSPRVIAAIRAADEAGYLVVPATGRPPYRLLDRLAPLGLTGPVVVCNGAATVSSAGAVLHESPLPAHVVAATVEALRVRVPGVRFAVVRDGGHSLLAETDYPELVTGWHDHLRDVAEIETAPLADVIGQPCTNLVVRHATVGPRDLADVVGDLPGVVAMYSNDDFLEVQAVGLSKAAALARVCAEHGFTAADVVAFGDSRNDAAMLTWAGRAVAMGNASDEIKALADLVAPSNADDGVAVVIEEMLAGDRR
jgi:HAD superfamily hydrolase (TIGR01484 family)